jgi:4-hydroxy-tetrahydrodipicolinate reductase
MLRVGVFGAGGRMGATVAEAVAGEPDLELAGAVDPARAGSPIGFGGTLVIGYGPEVMEAAGVEVAVDFTVASAALENARWCADHGVHLVIGTTGFGERGLEHLRALFAPGPANCVVVPNFAIGAVLMMRFAELAAPWFENVEVVELHHDAKLDAPSGTALLTAARISAARGARPGASPEASTAAGAPGEPGTSAGAHAPVGEGVAGARAPGTVPEGSPARGLEAAKGVRVHSVRLRGLVAHHEVVFGTTGQTLTIRHDSLDRSSFMAGVLLAIREVPKRRGLTVGLDSLLGL